VISRLLIVVRHAWHMWRALALPKNSRKGGWNHMPAHELLHLLKRECEELQAACWELEHHGGAVENVVREAADISNFAAMIADNAKAAK